MPTSFDRPTRHIHAATLLALLIGCTSARAPMRFGDYQSVTPSFQVPAAAKSADRATVKLAAPAYVAMLYVVPGRGSVVVYPADTTSPNYVDAGEHELEVHWAMRPMNRDSLFAEARRQAARGIGPSGVPRISRQDSLESAAARGRGPIAEPNPASSPFGYLLLVTSPSSLSLSRLKRRVEGLSIPFEDAEALETVMKLVKGTLPSGAALAGYAQEVAR